MIVRGRGNRSGFVVALAIVAIALAGCGSDRSATAQKPQVTQKRFQRLGYKVCRHAYMKQARLTEAFAKRHGWPVGEHTQKQQEAINRAIVMPIVREKIRKLSALPLPPGEKPKMEAVIASMRRGIRMTEAHPEWLAAPTAKHPETFAEARETTGAAGIWVCGQA